MDRFEMLFEILKEIRDDVKDTNEKLSSMDSRITKTESTLRFCKSAGTVVIAPLVIGVLVLVVQKLFF